MGESVQVSVLFNPLSVGHFSCPLKVALDSGKQLIHTEPLNAFMFSTELGRAFFAIVLMILIIITFFLLIRRKSVRGPLWERSGSEHQAGQEHGADGEHLHLPRHPEDSLHFQQERPSSPLQVEETAHSSSRTGHQATVSILQ